MPNLVVYVPAKLWSRLEDELGTEFPAWARQMTVKHMQEFLDGRLPERVEVGVVAESRDVGERAQKPAPSDSRTPDLPAARSGSCPSFPPVGTKCKMCGKVHPL